MPNTLAHIGAQLPITRCFLKQIDPRWVALGLLIPDLPWVFQRLIHAFDPDLSPINTRAYLVVMSTPLFCWILSAAIALCVRNARVVFAILATHSLLHLCLDASQSKGGIGIPFFGPLHWQCYSWPLFSMDGWTTNTLTAMGAFTLLFLLFGKVRFTGIKRHTKQRPRLLFTSVTLLAIYGFTPSLLMNQVIDANIHDLKLWKGDLTRTGMQLHFDRARYQPGKSPGVGEIIDELGTHPITIEGIHIEHDASVSTIATFKDETTLIAEDYVVHPNGRRFWYTIYGLLGVISIWLYPIFKPQSQQSLASK